MLNIDLVYYYYLDSTEKGVSISLVCGTGSALQNNEPHRPTSAFVPRGGGLDLTNITLAPRNDVCMKPSLTVHWRSIKLSKPDT